ncbi:efflux RND transporter permease subunit (plasmid) [Pontibacillus sp. ALD_SL1]|uniref:efflux RND transporter permease subunit n=1 Tax=Pontibacillus sp. ALD_SL1 TaxID=2777185 RepID=UPI001A97365E|nr:efflux RND transporter permease subunit [Pontibacillus sp. ALD_SL1]QST02310.1 efflux RND transporter permease subunit [Pontibacillus sp. ALD_SL1]
MNFTKWSVKQPISIIMIMCFVLIMGGVSFSNLKTELMPNISPPVVAVMTSYPGAGPEEVERTLTEPLEGMLGTASGIKTLESRSSQGSSLIIIQYDWETDIAEKRNETAALLEQVSLPDDALDPVVLKFDPTMMPLMTFSVSNGQQLDELQESVEDDLIPSLLSVEGVADITVAGSRDEEILVSLDPHKLEDFNLTQQSVTQFIRSQHITFPGGTVEDDGRSLNLRVLSEIDSIKKLEDTPVSLHNGLVLLKDIGTISKVQTDKMVSAYQDGKESLLLEIKKEGDANSALVAKDLREILAEYEEDGFAFSVSLDQGEAIDKSVSNVTKALLYGALFAIVVILLFLKSIRATLIIGVAIPFSVVSTFVLMYFTDLSLNIMSLGGLALGIGMLVDNAIVVIENIYRHLRSGKQKHTAAINGTLEISGAVTASMLTTLSVFLPIVFVGGMIGDLFKELAITVVFSLLSSWAVALTVVPSLATLMLKEKKKNTERNRWYENILRYSLRHRLATLFGAFVLFLFSFLLIPSVGTEFMPQQDEGSFVIDIETPHGSTTETTYKTVQEVQGILDDLKEVDRYTSTIGSTDAIRSSASGTSYNHASITVNLIPDEKRSLSTRDVLQEIDQQISFSDNTSITLTETNSMSALSGDGNTIDILLSGKDSDHLSHVSKELSRSIEENIDSVTEVISSEEESKPEIQFLINRENAFKHGASPVAIGTFINEMVKGQHVFTMSENGEDWKVHVKTLDVRSDLSSLGNTEMTTSLGRVPLSELGTFKEGNGPVLITRQNGERVISLKAHYENGDMGSLIRLIDDEIEAFIDENDTGHVSIDISGGAETMKDSFQKLTLALVLAIVFVYMVMASVFQSLSQPLIIMASLPFALIGVVYGLFLSGYAFGITAFIGIIILVGIVVNNAIVFIDYFNTLSREKELPIHEALMEAGTTRLRPIVMTALTTMLGLLPLALGTGEGAQMQAPMGIAVIGGLLTSTLLTLVVIPVMISLLGSAKNVRKTVKAVLKKLKEEDTLK